MLIDNIIKYNMTKREFYQANRASAINTALRVQCYLTGERACDVCQETVAEHTQVLLDEWYHDMIHGI